MTARELVGQSRATLHRRQCPAVASPGEQAVRCLGGVQLVISVPREREVPPVVGVFPHPAPLLRLAGAVLVEAHDEWTVGDRRYLSEASTAALITLPAQLPLEEVAAPAPMTA